MQRISKKDYYMAIAIVIGIKSSCAGRHVGAVVTDKTLDNILSTGYNGNARALSNECEDERIGYDCGCLHAEQNAIAHCYSKEKDKVLFSQVHPCLPCSKWAIQLGFKKIIYLEEYVDPELNLEDIPKGKQRKRQKDKLLNRDKTRQYLAESDIVLEQLKENLLYKRLRKFVHNANPSNYSAKIFQDTKILTPDFAPKKNKKAA